MRRIFLPVLLSLALGLPSQASASEALPQWTNSFGMSFRLIPAGKTVMGREGWAGVSPRREVSISREFGMGTTEVTQGQWKAVMGGKNPSEPFLGNDLPVNRVSWDEAQAFIKKLNELDAPRRYRLPSNAEWEHAYRAGNHATWITGDGTLVFPESLKEYEWFGHETTTHPVAQKKPNDWGLYDMGGNVREWVQDYWDHAYYASMPSADPKGPEAGKLRVWRGASYEDPIEYCSFVGRDGDKPSTRNKWTGFRVVLEGDSLRTALGGDSMKGKGNNSEAIESPLGVAPADVPAAYVPVLDSVYDLLVNGLRGRDWQDGEIGIVERFGGEGSPESLKELGWRLLDLSGDGTPELLIAPVSLEKGKHLGRELFAVYTIKNGKAYLVKEGMSRSSYALMNRGQLFYMGADGAMTRIVGSCGLTGDGTALVWNTFLFTKAKDNPSEIGYYKNRTGKLDKQSSQEISAEAFEKQEETLLAQRKNLEFTPFSDWRKASLASGKAGSAFMNSAPAVTLQWAKDVPEAASAERFDASSAEPVVQVAVCAERAVKDIKVLGLEFVDVSEDGKVSFKTRELFRRDSLESGRPLIVAISFIGTIPQYGISYTDEQGETCRYAIAESGKDGSLQLVPF